MVHVKMNSLTYRWNPMDFLDIDNSHSLYALLILNRPINIQEKYMVSLWNKACVRVTVDGGTNCWHKFAETALCGKSIAPDLITGDMDSVQPDILAFYEEKGTEIIKTPDQNETDFTKALRQTMQYIQHREMKLNTIIAVVEASGRLDQIIGNINTLHKAESIVGDTPVFLMGRNSLTWLLKCGDHEIAIPEKVVSSQKWCSLIPFGSSARVTTTGLKWNLDDRIMEFGKLISTSNSFNGSPIVTVTSDSNLVWSMGLDINDKNDDEDDNNIEDNDCLSC